MARRPRATANCSAKSATPPVPWISTVSPGTGLLASTSAVHAVSAAIGSVDASLSLNEAGAVTVASSASTI